MDIKLPLGLIFTIIGLILIISGATHTEEIIARLHFNFNLWWGIIVTFFGTVMLLVHFNKKKKI